MHQAARFLSAHPFALAKRIKQFGVVGQIGGVVAARINHQNLFEAQIVLFVECRDLGNVAEQYGLANTLFHSDLGGLEHPVVVGLVEYHAFWCALSLLNGESNELVVAAKAAAKLLFVGIPVGDGLFSHTRFHRRAGDRRSHGVNQSRVKGFRNNVVGSERQIAAAVGEVDDLGDGLFGEVGDRLDRRELHGLVDLGGAHVEGSAKDVGKAQHVVDLVRIVAAAGGHNQILAGLDRDLVVDFGVWIRQRKDHWVGGHGFNHLGAQNVAL